MVNRKKRILKVNLHLQSYHNFLQMFNAQLHKKVMTKIRFVKITLIVTILLTNRTVRFALKKTENVNKIKNKNFQIKILKREKCFS